MNYPTNWKKLMWRICWVLTAVGIIVFYIVSKINKNNKKCTDIKIEIVNTDNQLFIDEKDILELLTTNGNIIGKPIQAIVLRELESIVEQNKWAKNAEIYFDNNQVLQIKIEERVPIARIFQADGNSFYIDTAATLLPLSNKVSARVPLFTGCSVKQKNDTGFLKQVIEVAKYIHADSFYTALIAQIEITPNNKFEIIPLLGSHIVRLGDAAEMNNKLHRLAIFYKQAWMQYGINQYQVLDVQYDNQVIGIKNAQLHGKQRNLVDTTLLTGSDSMAIQPVKILPKLVVIHQKPKNTSPKRVVLPKVAPKQIKTPKTLMPKNNKTIKKPLRS